MGNEIEIYWTGRAYDFDGNKAEPGELHDTWRQADAQGLRVVRVRSTSDGHKPRSFVATPSSKDAEERYERYLKGGTAPEPMIKVKA